MNHPLNHKIAFVHYGTVDLDRAVAFYQNVLGMKLLFKLDDWAEFDLNGQRLALRRVDRWEPEANAGAMVHLEARPIELVVEVLKNKGVAIVHEIEEHPYGKMATFLDPDGNRIGLYQPPDEKKPA
ncbi:putative enzyme related to lactoylglutathione lyase [Nitrospina gracilis]|uniref:VOC family protein n=1 Tax=Nitrospina TaxID=35800 RepID=UPI000349FFBC|nr:MULTISPECIES: VOC family protein [Nitrospina]MCF8724279.1 putative enzyme related to lactoylglutathione lyase [Nitrospina sp. Nb-3]